MSLKDTRLDGTPRCPVHEHETELERELRLDEERIADEMEWHNLRGIVAPDY